MQQRLVQENAPLGGKRPIFLAKDPPIAKRPLICKGFPVLLLHPCCIRQGVRAVLPPISL